MEKKGYWLWLIIAAAGAGLTAAATLAKDWLLSEFGKSAETDTNNEPGQ